MVPLPSLLLVLLAVSASSEAVLATAGGNKLKHIHLYMHETMTGPDATGASIVSSPFGANATFGQVAVFDDELRAGRDRASLLVARYQGLIAGTGQASPWYLSSATVVFVAGEHAGSTLSVEGPMLGFTRTVERSVIGGTGKFRMARGDYLVRLLGLTSPVAAVYEVDFFVLSGGANDLTKTDQISSHVMSALNKHTLLFF